MDDQTKSRIRELMFYVVPDPDEVITDEVLERSEAVDYEEGNRLKAEFRSIIESLDEYPDVRQTILAALDDLQGPACEPERPCLQGHPHRHRFIESHYAVSAILVSNFIARQPHVTHRTERFLHRSSE